MFQDNFNGFLFRTSLLRQCAVILLVACTVVADDVIHQEIKSRDIGRIRNLLADNAGALEVKNSRGETLLHTAVMTGDGDVVRLLIEAGADVNARDHALGGTSLMMAAMLGYRDIVNMLLAEGAEIDAVSFHGSTALHLAAHEGHVEIVDTLLNMGANPEIKNRSGVTPLDMAQQMGRLSAINSLSRARVKPARSEIRALRILQKKVGSIEDQLRKNARDSAKLEAALKRDIERANKLQNESDGKKDDAIRKIDAEMQGIIQRVEGIDLDGRQARGLLEQELSARRQDLNDLREALDQTRQDVASMRAAMAQREEEFSEARQHWNATQGQLSDLTNAFMLEKTAEQSVLQAQSNELYEVRRELIELIRRLDATAENQAVIIGDIQLGQEKQDIIDERFMQATDDLDDFGGQLNAVRQSLRDLQEQQFQTERQLGELADVRDNLPPDHTEQLHMLAGRVDKLTDKLSRFEQSLTGHGEVADNTLAKAGQALEKAGEFDGRIDELQTRIDQAFRQIKQVDSLRRENHIKVADVSEAPDIQQDVISDTQPEKSGELFEPVQIIQEPEQSLRDFAGDMLTVDLPDIMAPALADSESEVKTDVPASLSASGATGRWWFCVTHVHTAFSSGQYDLPTLTDVARDQEVDAVFLSDSWVESIQYGLSPLRNIFWLRRQNSSVSRIGVSRYLRAVQAENERQSDVLYVPGVEVTPRIYWTGSLAERHLVCHNHQRNIIVMGIQDDGVLENLPVVNGYIAGRDRGWVLLTRLVLLLFLATCFVPVVLAGRLSARSGIPVPLIVRSFIIVCVLPAAVLMVAVNFAASRRDVFDIYSNDQPGRYEQKVLDSLVAGNLVNFWAHPEAPDLHEFSLFGFNLIIKTDPYPDVLLKTSGFTGFAGLNEGSNQVILPGAIWDQMLLDYQRLQRANPPWCFGEMLYHYEGQAGKKLANVQTVVWSPSRKTNDLLESIRRGAFYARRNYSEYALELRDWRLNNAASGMTASLDDDGEVRLNLSVTGAAREDRVEVVIVRNGLEIYRQTHPVDFELSVTDNLAKDVNQAYYRAMVIGKYPVQLVTNPIFVKRTR